MVQLQYILILTGINNLVKEPYMLEYILLGILLVCALIIAVAFMLQLGTFEGNEWGVVAAGITIAGSIFMIVGSFRNAKLAGKK